MAYDYYDRYSLLRRDGTAPSPKYVPIPKSANDKWVKYERGRTKMDKVSQDYYSSPHYAWLIMYANAQYGFLEYDIPDGVSIRIPYPLKDALQTYQQGLLLSLTS